MSYKCEKPMIELISDNKVLHQNIRNKLMLPCIIFVIRFSIETKFIPISSSIRFYVPIFSYDTYSYSFTLKTFVVLCNRGSKKLEIIYPYFLYLIFRQKGIHTLMHAFDAWVIIVFEASYICANTHTPRV